MPNPYDRVTFRGKTVDHLTMAALQECERRLGYDLTIVQGSYNAGGVSASAGTHDGGGVVDLLEWDHQRKCRVLREVGFAAWYRPTIPGLWNAHIHAVLVGHDRLAASAERQVAAYRAGRNGLANNAADPTWRPDPIPVFKMPGTAPRVRRPATFFVDVHPKYQEGFDFAKARAEGIRGAVIKATEGESVAYGDAYTRMMADARAAGLYVAAYHWLHAGDAAYVQRQAEHLARTIGDKNIPVMVDVEKGSTLPRIEHVVGFVGACSRLGLKVSMLYLPRWYWSGDMGQPPLSAVPELGNVALWNSAYGPNLALTPRAALRANMSLGRWSHIGGKRVTFLQFGSRVKAAGKEVDGNVYRGPADDLARWFLAPGELPPAEPSADVVSWNAYARNPDQAAGALAVVDAAFKVTGRLPDMLGLQEGASLTSGQAVGRYVAVVAEGDRNPVLVKARHKVVLNERRHGSKGIGDGVNQRDRTTHVVGVERRNGLRQAVVNAHLAHLGDALLPALVGRAVGDCPEVAQGHAVHVLDIVSTAEWLRREGWQTFVTADANTRPHDGKEWEHGLAAQLKAAGWTVVRSGLDLVAFHPSQVTARKNGGRLKVPSGSNHDPVWAATRVVEKAAGRR